MTRSISRRPLRASILGLASFFLIPLTQASAALITDPVGDFLPSYTGPHNADLDVVSAQVFFNGTNFTFTSTLNGIIGTTPTALYVWGINRGSGTAGFADIAPGVLFDEVFVLNDSTTGTLRDLINGTATTIAGVIISGSTITAVVPLADLPSEGFSAGGYQVNLWPRSGSGGESVISDFAPNNSDAAVTLSGVAATPEPAMGSLVGSALLLLGASFLGRRKRQIA